MGRGEESRAVCHLPRCVAGSSAGHGRHGGMLSTSRLRWPTLGSTTRQGVGMVGVGFGEKCDVSTGRRVREPRGPIDIIEPDVPDHPRLQELPEIRQGSPPPLLALATRRVRATTVRTGEVPRRRPREATRLHRRLAGAQPDGVSSLPLVSEKKPRGKATDVGSNTG